MGHIACNHPSQRIQLINNFAHINKIECQESDIEAILEIKQSTQPQHSSSALSLSVQLHVVI